MSKSHATRGLHGGQMVPMGSKQSSWADRSTTGIAGLDYLLRGGLPSHRIHLIEGHPGAGKTTFGLQFLLDFEARESCMYITCRKRPDELRATHPRTGGISRHSHSKVQAAENLLAPRNLHALSSVPIELGDLSRTCSNRRNAQPARAVLDSVSVCASSQGTRCDNRRQVSD